MPSDIEAVDGYLAKWDEFARGANALFPELDEGRPIFEAALARLLAAGDRRAPARLVFSSVVRVGGVIPVDSGLGRAATAALGPDVPITESHDGGRGFCAWDLFAWWERNRARYESFPLLDEWADRDYTRRAVIPLYRTLAGQDAAEPAAAAGRLTR